MVNLVLTIGREKLGTVEINMKKYNYIYKTTNLVNGKIYIGVHSTNKLKDGYIGLGIKRHSDALNKSKKSRFYNLAHAVCKYGYENFKKEILYFFKNAEDAYYFESKIITEEFIKNKNNYNSKIGGICPPNSKGIRRTLLFKKQKSINLKKYIDKLIEYHSKEYVIIDLDSNIKYEIKNLKKFCKQFNLNKSSLYNVALGRSRVYNKRWVVYTKKDYREDNIYNLKVIKLYHKNGDTLEVRSLKEAVLLTGVDKSCLSKVIRSKLKQTKGWSIMPWSCKKW